MRMDPNYVEWAKHLLDREDVAIALEQAYNQGYSLGYLDGKDRGWIEDWEIMLLDGIEDLENEEDK